MPSAARDRMVASMGVAGAACRNARSYGPTRQARRSHRGIWLETRPGGRKIDLRPMLHQSLVPLVAAVANAIIFVLVLRGGMNPIRRVFAWMTLTIISWNLDIFALYYFPDAPSALWWSMVFRTGVCLVPAAVFHAVCVLTGASGRVWSAVLGAGYAAGAFLVIANFRGALVNRLTLHSWGWYIEPAPLYSLMTALILIYFPLSIARVAHTYRHPSSARQRTQAKFWLLAIGVSGPFDLTNLLPIYGINVYPLGSFGNAVYLGIIAYAIARHRLMDVDYVVRKAISFFLAASVVLIPGGTVLFALSRTVGGEEPAVVACAAVGLALLSVVLIPTFQEALETRVHRAFFPQLYDYRRRLHELAAALVHLVDRNELVRRLGESLTEILDVETCEIFLPDEAGRRATLAHPVPATPVPLPEEIGRDLEQLAEPVLASEVEGVKPGVASLFQARGWEVGIPLRINDRLNGFIGLGQKKDFRIFSAEDLQLLSAVASGATVALENANLSRQLRHSEAVLERANRLSSLGTLAAGLAHEIRNPLVAVKTFLDLLPQRLDDRQFLSEFRELSLSELRRVTDLIADLLTLGKSRTPDRRSVDLPSTLEPVVRLMETTARKRQVELGSQWQLDLPPVSADPDQLKQIVLNLLLNAIETSAAGGRVVLDVHGGTLADTGSAVVLEVRDRGPGIPAEQLEHIFHPFYTTKETGTGLGLALVHQMVVDHGGEIAVESTVGE
ncbi:MAG: hypothetical protein E6J75_10580, partial [Deltaproteobacteria bacterium]